ncbi:MAG: cytochrome P450 [Deltaproteobacteria bacterium]|nr:cytochrome P450 [Deltaproteobacteria bacterium]
MLSYDPFSPDVIRDPYPFYKRLRDEAPAYYLAKYDCWALSRFDDIWSVSSDTQHFTATKGTASAQVVTKDQPVTPMLNSMDPPAHSKLRAVVRQCFLPKHLREVEPAVRAMLADLLAPQVASGGCDIVCDVAARLSIKVACMAIGLPAADGEYLHRLVQRFFQHDPAQQGISADGWAAMTEMTDYSLARVRDERRAPRGEPQALPALCGAELDGRKLTDEEIASHLTLLIVGGSETFPKTLANGLVRLWQHPDQRAQLVRDPSGIPDAYDEILRFDMPTQFLCRTVKREIVLHGETLRPDQGVLMLYPSANRDEREFANPDVFDVNRKPQRIASFGAGQHACLGTHVARLEGKLCLEAILAAAPNYSVDLAQAERFNTEFVQGYARLPIAF